MSNEYLDYKADDIAINKMLVQKYPFLKNDENYEYTWADDIPDGWKYNFGEQMLDELLEALGDYASKWKILQVKEKFGRLRIYHAGAPYDICDKVSDIISKYEELSWNVCVECGKPATLHTTGWILPMCEDCYML